MDVCGKDIRVEGRLIRIAHIDGDKYTFPDDLEMLLEGLRKCGTRIDLFTFLQKVARNQTEIRLPDGMG